MGYFDLSYPNYFIPTKLMVNISTYYLRLGFSLKM